MRTDVDGKKHEMQWNDQDKKERFANEREEVDTRGVRMCCL